MTRIIFAAIYLFLACTAKAQQLKLTLNEDSGIYAKGEKIVVRAHANAIPNDTITVRILSANKLQRTSHIMPHHADFEVFSEIIDTTCAIMVEVHPRGQEKTTIGFVVAPEGFQPGYEEPADLMSYWEKQKRELKSLPMHISRTPLEVPSAYQGKYLCEDLEINCLGPAPVRAYMAKPQGARKRSLPIIILCRAAGVSGAWCRCQVEECVGNAAMGEGALSLDINAHGMLNGQDDAYYKMLEEGMLHNYYEHNAADRETYYFKGMYLRLLRAIEYMTQQPEWDGKRILVIGESQGGGQAVAAAGLDERVSAVVLNVPAMQDLGGARVMRRSGWPQPIENHPEMADEWLDRCLPYFDGSLLLRHSKAEIFCELGLIDTTCPPSSVWASLNGAKGKKTIKCVPFRDHSWPSGAWRPLWDEKYYAPRIEFIKEYLK